MDGKASVIRLRSSASGNSSTETKHSTAAKGRTGNSGTGRKFKAQLSRTGESADSSGSTQFTNFTDDLSTFGLRFLLFFFVWAAGWLGISAAWLVILVGLLTVWEKRKKVTLRQAQLAQHLDDASLVLAHTHELPSWVNFPDVNRAEWINVIVSRVWPHLQGAIEKVLVEKVEPVLKKKCPAPLKNIHFQRIKLGDMSPRVTGIKVYPQEAIDQREVIVDVDLAYNGNSDIEVFVKYGMTAGVSHVKFHGKLRIVLKPLMPVLPLIGAVSFTFTEKPVFGFDLTGLANVLHLPVLRQAIDSALSEKLAEALVFPNQVVLSLLPETGDLDELLYPEYSGFLSVTVLEAQDVAGVDFHLFRPRTSDLYATVHVGRSLFTTRVIHEVVSAEWNETFEVLLLRNEQPHVSVKLWDKGLSGDDELIGSCQVEEEDIHSNKELWLDVHAEGETQKKGKIRLKLFWRQIANGEASVPILKQHILHSDPIHLGDGNGVCDGQACKKPRCKSVGAMLLDRNHSEVGDGETRRVSEPVASAARGERLEALKEEEVQRPSVLARIKQTVAETTSSLNKKKPCEQDSTPCMDVESLFDDALKDGMPMSASAPASESDNGITMGRNDVSRNGLMSDGNEGNNPTSDVKAGGSGDITNGCSSPYLQVENGDTGIATAEPVAVLVVHILSAQGLKKSSFSLEPGEYHCRLTFDGDITTRKKTKPVRVSPLMTWNSTVHFSMLDVRRQELLVEVCRQAGTVVGTLRFGVGDLLTAKSLTSHGSFPLNGAKEEHVTGSALDLRLHLRALVLEDLAEGGYDIKFDSDDESNNDVHEQPLTRENPLQEHTAQRPVNEVGRSLSHITAPVTRVPLRQISESCVELSFRYSHLKHRLYVNVHQARLLVPCHVDGTSDPFIEAFLLPDEYRLGRRRTSARRKTCNPVFNENFHYPIPYTHIHRLNVFLAVRNSPFRHGAFRERMGEVIVSLKTINFTTADRIWYPLASRAAGDRNVSVVDAIMGTISYTLPSYQS